MGLKLALADVDEKRLQVTGRDVARVAGEENVLVVPTDVAKLDEVVRLRDKVYELWSEVRIICSGPTRDAPFSID